MFWPFKQLRSFVRCVLSCVRYLALFCCYRSLCVHCDVQVFSCPANLASHRRWHKPGANINATTTARKKATTTKKSVVNNYNNNNNVDNDDVDSSTARGSMSPLSLSDDNSAAIDLSSVDTGPGLKVTSDSVKDEVRAINRHEESGMADPRPFECLSCGKAFRRRSYLRKHVATVHPTQSLLPGLEVLDPPLKSCEISSYSPDSFTGDLQDRTGGHVLQGSHHSIQRLIQQRDDVSVLEQPDPVPVLAPAADPSASSYLCKFCPDSFANPSTLTGHVSKNHSLDGLQVAVLTM